MLRCNRPLLLPSRSGGGTCFHLYLPRIQYLHTCQRPPLAAAEISIARLQTAIEKAGLAGETMEKIDLARQKLGEVCVCV